jgi:transcription elongation GreA/GreB family factor
LQRTRETLLTAKSEVALGALVACDFGGAREFFFLAPVAGGQVLSVKGTEITVISPHSPIAARMVGRRAGEGFSLANGAAGAVVAVS